MKEDRLVPRLRGKESAANGKIVGLAGDQAPATPGVYACASLFILRREDLPLRASLALYYHRSKAWPASGGPSWCEGFTVSRNTYL